MDVRSFVRSFGAVTNYFYLTFTQTWIARKVAGKVTLLSLNTQYSQHLAKHQRAGHAPPAWFPSCWFTKIFALEPVCSGGTVEPPVSRFTSFALKELKLLTNQISLLWLVFFCFFFSLWGPTVFLKSILNKLIQSKLYLSYNYPLSHQVRFYLCRQLQQRQYGATCWLVVHTAHAVLCSIWTQLCICVFVQEWRDAIWKAHKA